MYARQAIVAKYYGATNHRGSRIIVRCDAGKKTVPWDSGLDRVENFAAALRTMAEELEWDHYESHLGALPNGSYVLVFTDNSKDGTRVTPLPKVEPIPPPRTRAERLKDRTV